MNMVYGIMVNESKNRCYLKLAYLKVNSKQNGKKGQFCSDT